MMFTLMLPFVLIPLVGLAIDATMLYTVQLKLQAAVDGGALAAANSLSAGLSTAAQQSAMTLAADEFMRANLSNPGGGTFWGAYNFNDSQCNQSSGGIVPTGTVTSPITYGNSGNCIALIQDNVNKMRNVQIVASLQVPLLFMRILGFSTGTVMATGTASRRDVVMVLVIDRSGSMSTELTALQQGATYFVSQFQGGRDKLGLVLMAGSSIVAYPPTDWGTYPPTGKGWQTNPPTGPDTNFNNPSVSPNMLDSLTNMVSSGGNTGMAEALQIAYKELQAANEPGALNIIVLWTDGEPNGITVDFNGGSLASGALGTGNNWLKYTRSGTSPNYTYSNNSGCTNTNDNVVTGQGQYPNFSATSIVGWMAQWGGYASDSASVLGPFVRAQNTNGPTTLPAADYNAFVNNTSVASFVNSTKIQNDNDNGNNSNESIMNNQAGAPAGTGAALGCSYLYQQSAAVGSAVPNPNNIGTTFLSQLPSQDWYGDSTQGSSVAPYTQHDFTQSAIWTSPNANCNNKANVGVGPASGPLQLSGTFTGSGAASPYNTPMTNACQFGLASWNAADMAGRTIHQDTTLTPIIYTMGYAGTVSGPGGVDYVLLERLANCEPNEPCSPGGPTAVNTVYTTQGTVTQYNTSGTIPTGMYIQIQQVSDVTPAFQILLSQILRLSN
jgi:Flp pilus assembly protein TadG